MKYAISYVSTTSQDLSENEIQSVLNFSKNWNIEHHVSGILLYSDGNFFQVLEGEKQLLLDLFERIKNDPRHYDVIKIFQKEIFETEFNLYKVDFISLDSRYRDEDIYTYFSQIESLNPTIQTSVKYILNKFAEGIK